MQLIGLSLHRYTLLLTYDNFTYMCFLPGPWQHVSLLLGHFHTSEQLDLILLLMAVFSGQVLLITKICTTDNLLTPLEIDIDL